VLKENKLFDMALLGSVLGEEVAVVGEYEVKDEDAFAVEDENEEENKPSPIWLVARSNKVGD